MNVKDAREWLEILVQEREIMMESCLSPSTKTIYQNQINALKKAIAVFSEIEDNE